MEVPIIFRKSSENVISTYNWVDIAEGTGMVNYYIANSGANCLFLTPNVSNYSWAVETQTTGTSTAFTIDARPFNTQKVVKGTAFLNCSYGASGATTALVSAKIQHFDGTTATDISPTLVSPTANAGEIRMAFLTLPLTEKVFKVGDNIRVYLDFQKGNSNNHAYIGHDPAGRDGVFLNSTAGVTIRAIVSIPFKLDL